MQWTVVPFGKYEGKTLPEIIVRDLDWFFWALPKLYGKLADEAQTLARKARAIRVPKSDKGKLEVEYRYELGGRFCGFSFVEADNPNYTRWTTRLPYLDLTRALRGKYDKRAGRIMIQDFRIHYFGKHKRLTKDRCEKFFSNDRKFISG
jgi:hypothetical protein